MMMMMMLMVMIEQRCCVWCDQAFLQSNHLPLSDDLAVKLRSHIENIVASLPADLQSVLT